MEKKSEKNKTENKINLDYDWNSEYGDGDIPDIDKNSTHTNQLNQSNQSKQSPKNKA
ncbi:hypothetical protein [Anaerosporobacter faecicola]|uniref:hypothetical protein n=1 Tax=Anaerosporobacter faecicola TaxID=2718714 RepID=UPI00143AF17C|nr:hypothetical protein [Anaerosporobacter faecicola]